MKHFLALSAGLMIGLSSATAQQDFTERDVYGTWKLVVDLDDVSSELNYEARQTETILAEAILESVAAVIESVTDNIDLYMSFEKDGRVYFSGSEFAVDDDIEDTEWYVRNNRLIFKDTGDFYDDGDDSYWIMKGNHLILEDDNRDENVRIYLKRAN